MRVYRALSLNEEKNSFTITHLDHSLSPLSLPLSLSTGGGQIGGDAPAECVFPAAGFRLRRRRRGGTAQRVGHGSVHLVFDFHNRTLTFLFPVCPHLCFFFFVHGGGARRLVKKPTEEIWLNAACECVTDLDLSRMTLKWVSLPGLMCAPPPFSGPGGTKDVAGTCPGFTPARFVPVDSSYPVLRCPLGPPEWFSYLKKKNPTPDLSRAAWQMDNYSTLQCKTTRIDTHLLRYLLFSLC